VGYVLERTRPEAVHAHYAVAFRIVASRTGGFLQSPLPQ
jgi:hypothetical protein